MINTTDEIFAQIVEAKEVLFDKELRIKFNIEYNSHLKEKERILERQKAWNKLDAKRQQQIADLEARELKSQERNDNINNINNNNYSTHYQFKMHKNRTKRLIEEELERLRKELKKEKTKFKEKEKEKLEKENILKQNTQELKEKAEKEDRVFDYYYQNYTIIAKYISNSNNSNELNRNNSNSNSNSIVDYTMDKLYYIFEHYCRKNYKEMNDILIDSNDTNNNNNNSNKNTKNNNNKEFDLRKEILNDRNQRLKQREKQIKKENKKKKKNNNKDKEKEKEKKKVKDVFDDGFLISLKISQNGKKIIIVYDNIVAIYRLLKDIDDLENTFGLTVKFVGSNEKFSIVNDVVKWQKLKQTMRKKCKSHEKYVDYTKNEIDSLFN